MNGATGWKCRRNERGRADSHHAAVPRVRSYRLRVVESHQGTKCAAGGTAAFTVNVTNNGPNPAVGAQLSRRLARADGRHLDMYGIWRRDLPSGKWHRRAAYQDRYARRWFA